MSVLKNFEEDELIISCDCGCDEGIHIKIQELGDSYAFMTYSSGNFYKEQRPFWSKLKKIWAIIRDKDFYYSEVIMTRNDFAEFAKWLCRKREEK